jgi:23S rRNA pseudouridine1911/1915/1917 synthase
MNRTGTNPDIEIIFEDNHLLVVNKPRGVLSQEDYTGKPDLLSLCKQYIKISSNKPGNVFLGLLHRLDKPVSGVMVFAKTSKAASRISEQIRKRTLKKTYLAIVDGITPENGYLVHHLLKDEVNNLVKTVKKATSSSKEAQLTYIKLAESDGLSLLKINLITGRPHQIRVQMQAHGFPIWGDRKYGKSSQSAIALHGHGLSLVHPTLKKELTFKAKPEADYPWTLFQDILNE